MQARQVTGTNVIDFPTGQWRQPDNIERARGGHGLLMVEGLILRRVRVGGRHAAELLGPGDVLRPWQHDGSASTLDLEWTWRGGGPGRPPGVRARRAAGPPRRAQPRGRAPGGA